jgi:hypothetical protein
MSAPMWAVSLCLPRLWELALSPTSRRPQSLPESGPAWLNDPKALLRKGHAADALLTVYMRIRKGQMKVDKVIKMLHEMLNGESIPIL